MRCLLWLSGTLSGLEALVHTDPVGSQVNHSFFLPPSLFLCVCALHSWCLSHLGGRIAHLVEPRTKKQGKMLTRIQFPGAIGIFVPESALSADMLLMSIVSSSPHVQLHVDICAHVKNPYTSSHTTVWAQQYCTHQQEWVVLLLWLLWPYPVLMKYYIRLNLKEWKILFSICGA